MNTSIRPLRTPRRSTTPAARTADETRIRVLDTAARLFNESGYRGATMRSIAQETGIEAGSLYYHFGSKDELLSAVFELCMGEVLAAVKQTVAELPPTASGRDRIRAAIRAHLELLFRRGDYTSTNIRVFAQAPEHTKARCAKLRSDYEGYWKTLLADVVGPATKKSGADLSLVRPFLLGALNWTLEWYRPGKGLTLDQLADRYADLLFNGLSGASAVESL